MKSVPLQSCSHYLDLIMNSQAWNFQPGASVHALTGIYCGYCLIPPNRAKEFYRLVHWRIVESNDEWHQGWQIGATHRLKRF